MRHGDSRMVNWKDLKKPSTRLESPLVSSDGGENCTIVLGNKEVGPSAPINHRSTPADDPELDACQQPQENHELLNFRRRGKSLSTEASERIAATCSPDTNQVLEDTEYPNNARTRSPEPFPVALLQVEGALKQCSIEAEVSPDIDIVSRLEGISSWLAKAFANTHKYKSLLACRGFDAQALLDTFQSVLRICQPTGHVRGDLIVATRRLSSKTNLYPRQFLLGEVERLDQDPVAGGVYADIYRGMFQGRSVCLKVIRVFSHRNQEAVVKAIAREAIVWGQLTHRNLLPFWGLTQVGQRLALVSPWAVKGNILDFLESQPSAITRILLCSDIAGGVAYLHDNDIVHGDLKGFNVLVDTSSRAYVGDFGISGVDDPEILHWASQSRAASTGGTVRWQAPELLTELSVHEDASEDCSGPFNTKATDVYAWSCVCYEILTGQLPFFDYPLKSVRRKVRTGVRPTRVEEAQLWGLTDYIWALMNHCWAHDPSDRPSIEQALSRLSAVQPEDSRPSGEWTDGPEMQNQGLRGSDISLTLEDLEAIISRKPLD